VFGLVILSSPSFADIDAREFSTQEKLQSYQALTRELRCPKCQNQDIADSNAPIAKDMRAQVHRLVEEGKSHDQVVDFMVERFGEFVTYRPKVTTETYLLWYGPWVFVGIGLVTVLLLAKSKRSTPSGSGQSENNQEQSVDSEGVSPSQPDPSPDDGQKKEQSVDALLKRYGDD